MAQVNRQPGLSKQVLPMAGTAAGTVFGGPVGGMVGGMIGSKLASGDATPAGGAGAAEAIARRLNTPTQAPAAPEAPQAPSNPSQDLLQAHEALAYLPPEQQQKYGPIIRRARAIDAAQTGVA